MSYGGEEGVYERYVSIRKSIPEDDVVATLSLEKLISLFRNTLSSLLDAHNIEQLSHDAPGIQAFVNHPPTTRAWLALVRSPLLFNPVDWPGVFLPADKKLSSSTEPDELEAENDEIGDGEAGDGDIEAGAPPPSNIKQIAQFYTRFLQYPGISNLVEHAEAFDEVYPNYCAGTAALLQELDQLASDHNDIEVSESYTGVTIAHQPAERRDADLKSRWRLICNWLSLKKHRSRAACVVVEWKALRKDGADVRELRKDGLVSQTEFILVLATKPVGLNSAHGGYGLVPYKASEELEAIRRLPEVSMSRQISFRPASEQVPSEIKSKEELLRIDLQQHCDFTREIFGMLEAESTGPDMPTLAFDIYKLLASAVSLDAEGRLAEVPLIAKDITREAFAGGAERSYRGDASGPGPLYEAWLRSRALQVEMPLLGEEIDEADMRLLLVIFGPFNDLWAIILRHRDWIIILVCLFLSRYLLLFKKHGVPLPFFAVQSAKVCNLFLKDMMKACWKENVTDLEVEAFLNNPSLQTLLSVLPGDLQTLNTANLKELQTRHNRRWSRWLLENFTRHVGNLAVVAIGPRLGDESHPLTASYRER